MNFDVRVSPKASRNLVKNEGGIIKVYLTKPAADGQANAQLLELLADYFKVKKYQVQILKGHNSRNKIVSVSYA
jgi:uncharacterized protein (TIGR00251 family)